MPNWKQTWQKKIGSLRQSRTIWLPNKRHMLKRRRKRCYSLPISYRLLIRDQTTDGWTNVGRWEKRGERNRWVEKSLFNVKWTGHPQVETLWLAHSMDKKVNKWRSKESKIKMLNFVFNQAFKVIYLINQRKSNRKYLGESKILFLGVSQIFLWCLKWQV